MLGGCLNLDELGLGQHSISIGLGHVWRLFEFG